MVRILLVGYDPATVDFSDPALPPGLTAEKIDAGIRRALADLGAEGWEAEHCYLRPDGTAVPTLQRRLASTHYDCIVIGGGIRLPPKGLALFEAILNAVHKAAPAAAIAFNTTPHDSPEAVHRVLNL